MTGLDGTHRSLKAVIPSALSRLLGLRVEMTDMNDL